MVSSISTAPKTALSHSPSSIPPPSPILSTESPMSTAVPSVLSDTACAPENCACIGGGGGGKLGTGRSLSNGNCGGGLDPATSAEGIATASGGKPATSGTTKGSACGPSASSCDTGDAPATSSGSDSGSGGGIAASPAGTNRGKHPMANKLSLCRRLCWVTPGSFSGFDTVWVAASIVLILRNTVACRDLTSVTELHPVPSLGALAGASA
mmetsp:Transcript_24864/g.54671  ORF Transcript_24864/g.54671 Transcript_24864/m.54671 type:complete len:210 (+) Transcript_24864:109-738(+)